jgi:thiol:disulfide interchange protein
MMTIPTFLRILFMFVFLGAVTAPWAGTRGTVSVVKTAPVASLVWHEPVKGEVLAKKSGKPILYDFTAEWCGYCRILERTVFSNPKHAKRIAASFVAIRVMDRRREDGKNLPEVDELQRTYGVRGYPTLVVLKTDGTYDVMPGFAGEEGTIRFLKKNGMK